MAFDPIAEGASLASQQFDPIAEGATLVSSPQNQNSTPDSYTQNLFNPLMSTPTTALQQTGMVAGQNPIGRFALNAFTLAGLPEMRLGSPLLNVLGRIGTGTLATTALSAISPENIQNITDPNAMKQLGAENLGLNALLESVPYGLGKLSSLNPLQHARGIIDQLSGGLGLEDMGKSVAQDIQNQYRWLKDDPSNPNSFASRYNDIFNTADSLYPGGRDIRHPIEGINAPTELGKLRLSSDDFKDPSVRGLFNDYNENPTLQNAHIFQSQLGKEVRYLENNKRNLDQTGLNNLDLYNKMRSALKNDIYSGLEEASPDLVDQYKNVTKDYEKQIAPYYSDNALANIAEGKETNPTRDQLINIFRNPNENIQEVVNQQPDIFKNKISHLGFGLNSSTVNAPKVINAFNNFDKQGLGSYITPEVENSINSLKKKQTLSQGIGIGAGVLGGHFLPESAIAEILLGEIGAKAGPSIFNLIPKSAGTLNPLLSGLGRSVIASSPQT